jgi:hypothetical protein
MAKAYLAGTDSAIATRTLQQAIEALTNTKQGANRQIRAKEAFDCGKTALPRFLRKGGSSFVLRILQR